MIIGIGVDIEKTARFEGMTQRFLSRVYTSNERAYLLGKSHVSAAGLFAAKEAVAKALGTGFKGFWPSQVEVVRDGHGQPGVVLHGNAKDIADKLAGGQGYSLKLSISHTDSDAVAFVVMHWCPI
ncbi:MAG: holo-ACP synthase [Defluviitaleaceae bacterium]|nr:holo-ACP synthase [Defluviitaleaceae bacterium]